MTRNAAPQDFDPDDGLELFPEPDDQATGPLSDDEFDGLLDELRAVWPSINSDQ